MLTFLAEPVRAGVYNFAEPEEQRLSPDYLGTGNFHETLFSLKNIAPEKVEYDYPLRMRYRLQAQLANPGSVAKLSVIEKVNLSAVLMRCRKFEEAINLLRPLSLEQRDNFLVHANLATAYQLAGQLQLARDSLEFALSKWPKDILRLSEAKQAELRQIGWTSGPYELYRRMEEYQLKLIKLRLREGGQELGNVDALFDDGKKPPTPVKFVGESGAFEPGKIAKAEQAKLDAVRKDSIDPGPLDIVQQLLLWLPDDLRLYWLLGELYNARGDIEAAQDIFVKRLGDFKTGTIRAPEFRERMQVLSKTPLPERTMVTPQDLDATLKKNEAPKPAVDWRTLGIGGLIGAAVALFTLWQVREWRRRQQRRSVS